MQELLRIHEKELTISLHCAVHGIFLEKVLGTLRQNMYPHFYKSHLTLVLYQSLEPYSKIAPKEERRREGRGGEGKRGEGWLCWRA